MIFREASKIYEEIRDAIVEKKPYLIGKPGSLEFNELKVWDHFGSSYPINKSTMALFNNAGVFPLTVHYVTEWAELYLESLTINYNVVPYNEGFF